MRSRVSGCRPIGRLLQRSCLIAATGLLCLVAVAAPANAAKRWDVASTDDGAQPGTCPVTNSFGYPTGGNCFVPDVITIAAGDTVVWKGTGQRPHDVTADDGSFRSSGAIYPGKTWSYTFKKTGSFAYYCSLHGDKGGVGHAGKIVVTASGGGGPTPTPPAGGQPKTPGSTTTTQPLPGVPAAMPAGDVPPGSPAAPLAFAPIPTTLKVTVKGAPVAARAPAPEEGPGFGAGLLVGAFGGLGIAAWPRMRRAFLRRV